MDRCRGDGVPYLCARWGSSTPCGRSSAVTYLQRWQLRAGEKEAHEFEVSEGMCVFAALALVGAVAEMGLCPAGAKWPQCPQRRRPETSSATRGRSNHAAQPQRIPSY